MRKPVRYGENLNKATGDVYTCIYIFENSIYQYDNTNQSVKRSSSTSSKSLA